MRLRLGLLQDHAAIDKQIAKEAAEAAAKKAKADIPTVKTEAQIKAEEAATAKEKELGTHKSKSVASSKPKIRPLSEAKAIDSGANFISESFLFTVGLSLIVFESFRSRRKEASRRSEVAEQIAELEENDRQKTKVLEDLQNEVMNLKGGGNQSTASSSWFWPRTAQRKDEQQSEAKQGALKDASTSTNEMGGSIIQTQLPDISHAQQAQADHSTSKTARPASPIPLVTTPAVAKVDPQPTSTEKKTRSKEDSMPK